MVRAAVPGFLNEKASHTAESFKSSAGRVPTICGTETRNRRPAMPRFAERIRPHVDTEIRQALGAEARGHFDTAFRHLERAHVLGQRSTLHHVRVHWLMLKLAVRNGWRAEAVGQAWRVVAAALFTPLGLLPVGNPGAAQVSGFRPLPIPAEMQRLIDTATK